MRPEQPQGEVPKFNLGEVLEVNITNIEETTGKYGKQLQIDGMMPAKNGWRARAWIKHYPQPAPNQHLGKLCLAVERVTGQSFTSLSAAVDALKNYGRMYVKVTGFREYEGKQYPKFGVQPDTLPGEQPSQPAQPPTGLPSALPTQVPATPGAVNSTIEWLIAHQDIIGKQIPSEVYNKFIGQGIIEELHRLGHVKMVQDYPWLTESARTLLMK